MTRAELIAALEKATGPDRELFEAAFFEVFGKPSVHLNDEIARWSWYLRLLDAGAWLDAAMTLAKSLGLDELCIEITEYSDGTGMAFLTWGSTAPFARASVEGSAAGSACALVAACLKAIKAQEPTP